MKKLISLLFAILFIATFVFQIAVSANEAEKEQTRNNNTARTDTTFIISSSGMASVEVEYVGIPNIATGATIEITIKKRFLLVFWTTEIEEEYTVYGEKYSHTYYYDLSEFGSGTYKCNVTYTVSGSGGADDVIPFEDTASW